MTLSRRLLNALVLRPLAWILIRSQVTGRENVPQEPFILMVNHCNFLDPGTAMVTMLPRSVTLFTKAENLNLPVGGPLLRWYGVVPVRRGKADLKSMRMAAEILAQEDSILLVAPEGTRSYHGRLLPARSGLAFLATRTDAPVLPVGVSGVRDVWKNVRRLKRTRVQVAIGHPFRFRSPGRARKETLDAMTREAMYQLAALLPPEQWGAYSDMENATQTYLEFLQPGKSNLTWVPPLRPGRQPGDRESVGAVGGGGE